MFVKTLKLLNLPNRLDSLRPKIWQCEYSCMSKRPVAMAPHAATHDAH